MKKRALKSKTNKEKAPIDFIKKYPGFVAFAIIFVVVVALIFFVEMNFMGQVSEDVAYADEIYRQNQEYLDELLHNIDTELIYELENDLDPFYLASARDDIVWLKNAETQLHKGNIPREVLVKETAFIVFLDGILELNSTYALEIDFSDYSITINQALTTKIEKQVFISEEELDEIFAGSPAERIVFENQLNTLTIDYVNEKLRIINNSTEQERRYVEAKKLVILSYTQN